MKSIPAWRIGILPVATGLSCSAWPQARRVEKEATEANTIQEFANTAPMWVYAQAASEGLPLKTETLE